MLGAMQANPGLGAMQANPGLQGNPGLRERKKAATRQALSEAAMRLAMEHGIVNVTADAIAAAVDVAPRTFHNYFSCKEEAIVAVVADRAEEVVDLLRARPEGESMWDALQAVMIEAFADEEAPDEQLAARMSFIRDNAAVLSEQLTVMKAIMERLADVVAQRSGTDVDRDLYPRLQACAAVMSTQFAVDQWLADPSPARRPVLIRQAFAMMRAGLPEPSPGTAAERCPSGPA